MTYISFLSPRAGARPLPAWAGMLGLGILIGLAGCGPSAESEPDPDLHADEGSGGIVLLTPTQRAQTDLVIVPAGEGTREAGLSLQGTVMSPDTARVMAGSWVEGRVERLHVLEGDRVETGDPLVRIHSHELADWERAFVAAEAERDLTARAVTRGRELLAAGAISSAEFERRELEATRAQAALDQATVILRHLNPDGEDVMVLAQRSGTVLRIFVAPGEAVLPGTPLVELGSTDRLWISGALPETLAGQVRVGETAVLTFPALPGVEGTGTVISMGAQVDPLLRTLDLRVEARELPASVRLGMLATVQFGTASPDEADEGLAASVPVSALQRRGVDAFVFVAEGEDRFRALPVRVIRRDASAAVVVGLAPGTPVVAEGAYTLRAVLEGFIGPDDHE